MDRARSLGARLSPWSWSYVAAVTVCATIGFVAGSPWPIIVAAILSLPASLAAVPAYYVVYGLLALVPGANPSSSRGSGGVGVDGSGGATVVVGGQAGWFAVVAPSVGVLALTVAAIVNVLLLRALRSRRPVPERAGCAQPPLPSS